MVLRILVILSVELYHMSIQSCTRHQWGSLHEKNIKVKVRNEK